MNNPRQTRANQKKAYNNNNNNIFFRDLQTTSTFRPVPGIHKGTQTVDICKTLASGREKKGQRKKNSISIRSQPTPKSRWELQQKIISVEIFLMALAPKTYSGRFFFFTDRFYLISLALPFSLLKSEPMVFC